jgi:hypothetical protein
VDCSTETEIIGAFFFRPFIGIFLEEECEEGGEGEETGGGDEEEIFRREEEPVEDRLCRGGVVLPTGVERRCSVGGVETSL